MGSVMLGDAGARIWMPWAAGPEERTQDPVLVSLTAFTRDNLRDVAGIFRAGLRLRQGWYGLPGAVGLYLWADLPSKRSGSVSVWTNVEDMHRWIGVPLHVSIMNHYRTRGSLKSTTWETKTADRGAILAEAKRRLATNDYSNSPGPGGLGVTEAADNQRAGTDRVARDPRDR